jgi:hypothetical protein
MREAYLSGCAGDAMRAERGHRTARPAADWLGLAATPTFAIMALASVGNGPADILCAATSPLGGMTAMYVLMSAFHLPPWLKLIAGGSNGRQPPADP